MTNVQACLGLAQLERLEGFVETKKAATTSTKLLWTAYTAFVFCRSKRNPDGVRSNHWFYSLYLKDSGP